MSFLYAAAQIKRRIPMAEDHLQKVRDLFERYDTDKDDSLDLNELALLLQEISSKITPLPAVSISLICLILFTEEIPTIDCASRFSARKIPRKKAF